MGCDCDCGVILIWEVIAKKLYKSEINFSISTFWDAGIEVKLGDEMNGFVARTYFDFDDDIPMDDIFCWLAERSIKTLSKIWFF